LFFSAVEKATKERNEDVLEQPFEYFPKNKLILVGKETGIFVFRIEFEPADLVDVESI